MPQFTDVSLDVSDLTSDDVAHMREVLLAPDPLALLVGCQPLRALQTISASRFLLDNPTTGSASDNDAINIDSDAVLEDLLVLADSPMWTTVLLPGWGRAWVYHDDIKETKARAYGPFPVKSVPRLTLNAMQAKSKDAAKELLLTVVHHLTLGSRDSWRRETVSYDCVFDACPNLESLEFLCPRLDSIRFLVDGYVSGASRLAVFKATKRSERTLLADTLHELFVALSDEHHPAARYLCEFVVYPVALDDVVRPEIQSAITTMLTRNQRLSLFDIRFDIGFGSSADQREQCDILTKTFNGERVSSPRLPLDMRRCLAFLSTIRAQHQSTTQSTHHERAAEKLDADVLALIFKMAAKSVRRRVYVGPHYEERFQD